ncbi:neuroblast differentiation-associated protein AHNAK [Labrus bergylta]|uniref:neuroblast differentiation-associated protein AHNAK n=1 Tax=Labrus bergylta TaxID=56723 RepID=UPI003313B6C8
MMSLDMQRRSISDSLILDDTGEGVVIKGITDDRVAAKSGLQTGDEIVAATIHLDHLNKDEVLNILKVLEPYDKNMKVLTKKDLNTSAGLGSLGLGLGDPSEMLNLKKDLSLNANSEAPAFSLNGLSGNVNSGQGLGGDMSGPTLNGDIPSFSLNKPSANAGTKFSMPSLGLTGPDVKGDLDGTLKAPDFSVSTPKIDTTSPSIDIEKPDIKTGNAKYKPPKFTMPHFNMPRFKTPKAEADLPGGTINGNLEAPDLSLSGPEVDLKTPDINLKAPNADLDAPSGKIKWPHQNWKFPKLKGPDADLNAELHTPSASLSTPKIDGDLSPPDVNVNLPKADIKGPDVNVQTPNLDIDAPSGKFRTWKFKKPKWHGSKPDLDLDANVNAPDVDLLAPKMKGGISTPDINMPDADLKGADLDVEAPSGKFNWFHKLKKPRLHGPKADLNLGADGDLSVPKLDGEFSTPGVGLNLPKADVDVNVPDADLDAPSGKIKFPTLKRPKFLLSGPKVKTPDVDIDYDAKAPDLSVPPLSLDGPNVDVNAPNVDIDTPSGTPKWFSLKKPKWGLSGPKVNGPDVDLDADISAPDLSLQAPKIDGEINAPDLNLKLPSADLEAPKIDAPDVEAPSGLFKWFKKPTFGTLRGPKADIDADMSAPNLDLKAPDINLSAPKVDGGFEGPDFDVTLPKAGIKGPNMEVDSPDLKLDSPDGKLKFPKMKLPKFKGPKVKGPELDANLDTPNINLDSPKIDLDAPNVDLKTPDLSLSKPKIKGGFDAPDFGIDLPKFNIGGPKAELPNAELKTPNVSVSDPNFKLPKADVKAPDFNLSAPTIKGDLSAPNLNLNADLNTDLKAPNSNITLPKGDITMPKVDLKGPDAQLKTPDLDVDSGLGDFKMPNLKLPKFGLSDTSVKSGVGAPQVNIDTPTANVDLAPTVDLSGPKLDGDFGGAKLDVKAPNVDANIEKSKFPHFKFPKINFPGNNVKAPEIDATGNLDLSPDLKLKAPSVEGGISPPDVSVSGLEVDANLNKPNLGITAEADAAIKESPKSKLKWPFKFGRKSVSGDEEGNDVEFETGASNADVEIPAFKFHKLPRNSIDDTLDIGETLGLPKLETEPKDYVLSKGVRLPILNTTSKSGEKIDILERLKMAKEKLPSTNVSPTEAKNTVDLKFTAPSLDVKASTEGTDSSLVRGGTFKVEKPDAVSPQISTSDENDKLSLSLSNMLGLNIKDSGAD